MGVGADFAGGGGEGEGQEQECLELHGEVGWDGVVFGFELTKVCENGVVAEWVLDGGERGGKLRFIDTSSSYVVHRQWFGKVIIKH